MRTQSEDTSPEMERVQIELIRKASIAQRFAIMQSWSQFLIEANKQRIHKDHPAAREEEISLIFVARHYGQALADGLQTDLIILVDQLPVQFMEYCGRPSMQILLQTSTRDTSDHS